MKIEIMEVDKERGIARARIEEALICGTITAAMVLIVSMAVVLLTGAYRT